MSIGTICCDSFAHLSPANHGHLCARLFKFRLGVYSLLDCLSFMPSFPALLSDLVSWLWPRPFSTCPVCLCPGIRPCFLTSSAFACPCRIFGRRVTLVKIISRSGLYLPVNSQRIICSAKKFVFVFTMPDSCENYLSHLSCALVTALIKTSVRYLWECAAFGSRVWTVSILGHYCIHYWALIMYRKFQIIKIQIMVMFKVVILFYLFIFLEKSTIVTLNHLFVWQKYG